MDNETAGDYALALATLNAVVGVRFAELQAAMTSGNSDCIAIDRLKKRFDAAYSLRDGLGGASPETWRHVIDDHALEVRAYVKGAGHATDATPK